MPAKQHILPFFLPMQGCPARCVYCDQQVIGGQATAPAEAEIQAALAAFPVTAGAELAYYGGSFTCLPLEAQTRYLSLAAAAIAEGRIAGVRISTRPDAIDAESCAFLRAHGVRTVELGVQSFDDAVLLACGRGCTAADAYAACAAVKAAGLHLGVQLMTGLPLDSAAGARRSMKEALCCGAELLRIYPTLVLANTELAKMYARGDYLPQTLEQAISCCADMLMLATAAGVPVVRLGIHPSPAIEEALLAGPYHPAFGSLVKEELRARVLAALLAEYDAATPALLRFHPDELTLLFGQNRQRMQEIGRRWPSLILIPDAAVAKGELRFFAGSTERVLTEQAYCAANTFTESEA